ncbi:MAG: NAD-dependent dehydratase [Hyphomicrobiales bacterium]|nr:MAG: NAD-dependent dehydratase [Hyphomicrobiales bacterium]
MVRILITGAAGGLGGLLRDRMKGEQVTLRLSDVAELGEADENEDLVQCDLGDMSAVLELVKDCDFIVHLGGIAKENSFEKILNGNIVGTYNIYEAARQAGVKRIFFASSNHAMGAYEVGDIVNTEMPFRPDSFYGVSKGFGEVLARYYFDKYGIESACVRIGSCFEPPTEKRMLATWLSFDDFVSLVKRVQEIEHLGFQTIFAVSDNAKNWWDNSLAQGLGWQPKDSVDKYADDPSLIEEETEIAVRLHGGVYNADGHFDYNNSGSRTV